MVGRSLQIFLFLMAIVSVLSLFQNCGPQMVSSFDNTSIIEPLDTGKTQAVPDCQFNRIGLYEGDSITAYQTSTVPTGSTCVSEARVCRGGRLSGSFQFSTCLPDVPAACLQNGTTIPHNRSQTFYQSELVPFGSTCSSEERRCDNGSLSGSYSFSECRAQQPTDCQIGPVRWAHGQQKLFFKTSSVPFGQACESEYRKCHNGAVIDGSFTQTSCGIDLPRNCTHGGQSIGHDLSKDFFKSESVPFGSNCGTKKSISCFNGELSGDLTYAAYSCSVSSPSDCALYDGTPVPHLQTIIAYQFQNIAFGDDCEKYSKVLSCNNRVLTDSNVYKYASCSESVTQDCVLSDGTKINHGESDTLKKNKFIFSNESCDSPSNLELVSCTNGVLSGTARYRTCEPIVPDLLTAAGGNGGTPFEVRCQAPGARAIGLFGGAGTDYNRVGLICSITPNTSYTGGTAGTAFSNNCPEGKFLVGISGSSSTNYFSGTGYVKQVRMYCAKADGSNGEWISPQGTASTYGFFQVCPPGSVVVGLKGRSGTLIDQIQVMCAKMTVPINVDCLGQWINQGCSMLYRGGQYGDRAQRFFQTQPAGGTGRACEFRDGQIEIEDDGCGIYGGGGGGGIEP